MKLYGCLLFSIVLIISVMCTDGTDGETELIGESRTFGFNLDWNAIYESNFEPTNYFSNLAQNLVPVVISAVAGIFLPLFYQVLYNFS